MPTLQAALGISSGSSGIAGTSAQPQPCWCACHGSLCVYCSTTVHPPLPPLSRPAPCPSSAPSRTQQPRAGPAAGTADALCVRGAGNVGQQGSGERGDTATLSDNGGVKGSSVWVEVEALQLPNDNPTQTHCILGPCPARTQLLQQGQHTVLLTLKGCQAAAGTTSIPPPKPPGSSPHAASACASLSCDSSCSSLRRRVQARLESDSASSAWR